MDAAGKTVHEKDYGLSHIKVEKLEPADLHARGWVQPPDHFSLPEHLRKESGFTPEEKIALDKISRDYKKEHPQDFQKVKMLRMIMRIQNEFPSPKVIVHNPDGTVQLDGNEAYLKSFYSLITIRHLINGKRYGMTQYLTWLYRDGRHNPYDRMINDSVVVMIHHDKLLMNRTLPKVAEVFDRCMRWDRQNETDLKKLVGELRGRLAHIMPDERGSSSIEEWFEQAVYESFGLPHVKYNNGKLINLEALTSVQDIF